MATCAICLEPATHNHTSTSCCHTFHNGCLAQWLVGHSRCPVCRHNLGDPDDEQEEEVEDGDEERPQTTHVILDIDDGGAATDLDEWRLFDLAATLGHMIKNEEWHPRWKWRKQIWTAKMRGSGGRRFMVKAEVVERDGERVAPHLIVAWAIPLRARAAVRQEIEAQARTGGWHTRKGGCHRTPRHRSKRHSHR
jgi:hypothetical protein